MEITWKIAMVVFRSKQFAKKTGKNNWSMNGDKKVGFNRGNLRCFNFHEPGHFAHDFPKLYRRENPDRTLVPLVNNRGPTANNETANLAVLAQTFYWEDEIQALNITRHETANLVQISELPDKDVEEDAQAEMMQL